MVIDTFLVWLMSFVLVYVSITDIKHRRIPNVLTHPILVVLVFYRLSFGPTEYFYGLFPALILVIVFFISSGAIGAGDIKLLAIIGLCLGLDEMVSVLLWMCVGWLLIMIAARVFKQKNIHSVPLAPFITFGWMVTLIIN